MSSRYNNLFDNLTLSREKTDEIMRAARAAHVKDVKESMGSKSIYLTLAATLAAVLVVVFGGTFLINSGILERQPLIEEGQHDFQATTFATESLQQRTVDTVNLEDVDVETLNLAAMTARDSMSNFLQTRPGFEVGSNMPDDFASAYVVLRDANNRTTVSVWNTDDYTDIFRSTGEDELNGHLDSLFGEESLRGFRGVDSTFVFIFENDECSHAAFIPGVRDIHAINLVVSGEYEYTFSSVTDGRLNSNVSDRLKRGQPIGTAPVINHALPERVQGWTGVIEIEWADDYICAETAEGIAQREAIYAFADFLPPVRASFTTVVTDINLIETDNHVLAYRVNGIVHTVEGDSAPTRPRGMDYAVEIEIHEDMVKASFTVVIDAVTGEIIEFVMD